MISRRELELKLIAFVELEAMDNGGTRIALHIVRRIAPAIHRLIRNEVAVAKREVLLRDD